MVDQGYRRYLENFQPYLWQQHCVFLTRPWDTSVHFCADQNSVFLSTTLSQHKVENGTKKSKAVNHRNVST